jgi:uroporphyrinogen-III synthase
MNVCAFESRRGSEMASLIRRHGGEPNVVPTMREVPLESNPEAFEFAERLMQGQIDAVVFMTGVGASALREVIESRFDSAAFLQALDRCRIAVRGPKPTAVLGKWGVHIDVRAPEPNTWRELLDSLDQAGWNFSGMTVAIQEYGAPSIELEQALRDRGADVVVVMVYRWELPEDIEPLKAAIKSMIAGEIDVLLITSAQQIRHAAQVADEMGVLDAWLAALKQCVIGSIGPTSSGALQEYGLAADLEPSHPKMGHLVMETLAAAADIKVRKAQRVAN